MSKICVLLIVFLVLANAVCTVDEVIQCIETLWDMDGDGKLNATEINHHMLYQPCGPVYYKVIGETVIEQCDMNYDGYITREDLEYEPVNCASNERNRMQVCEECQRCNTTVVQDVY